MSDLQPISKSTPPHTNARTDVDLVAVWVATQAARSEHTRRAYSRIGHRFLSALSIGGVDLRSAGVEDVHAAVLRLRTTDDGAPASPATVSTYTAAVKSLLGFAHKVGFTRFNAAPLIKENSRLGVAQRAQRLLPQIDVELLIRAAKPGRDRLMLEVAYTGGLRVSELVSLTWAQIIARDTGEIQLALMGKGGKERNVLLPTEISQSLLGIRGESRPSDAVFDIKARQFNVLVKKTALRAGINSRMSAHWLRHAHASHAIDNGAPITLVSQTLGHADLKTTSVYAHAKPGDSSSRYLRRKM